MFLESGKKLNVYTIDVTQYNNRIQSTAIVLPTTAHVSPGIKHTPNMPHLPFNLQQSYRSLYVDIDFEMKFLTISSHFPRFYVILNGEHTVITRTR